MKVALFTETYLPYINGVVTHVKILKDGLEQLGHEVLVVCADPHTFRNFIKDGVLHCPASSFKKLYDYGLASPISLKRLTIIKKFNPDIIHIHNEFGVGFSGAMIAKILKKPLVYTLHTMYDEYLYYITPKPLIPFMKKTSHSYSKFLAKTATSLTGPSKKVEAYFKECGVNKEVTVINNPVELDIFEPSSIDIDKIVEIRERFGFEDKDTVACFCGRLGKEKSVDVLIKFWAKAVKPDDNLKLLIIGSGPSEQEFKQLAIDLNVSDTVKFAGRVEHPEIPPYYASADIYLTASLSEMYSISMLEAMATGQPVVHLFDELNESQLVEGVNGFVYHNEIEMYDILKKIRDMTDYEKAELKARVCESVKQAGCQDLAKDMLKIYNKILNEKK